MKIEEIKKEKDYWCTVYNLETGAISHEIVTGADLLNNIILKNGKKFSEYVRNLDIDIDDVISTYDWIDNPVVWTQDYLTEVEEEA